MTRDSSRLPTAALSFVTSVLTEIDRAACAAEADQYRAERFLQRVDFEQETARRVRDAALDHAASTHRWAVSANPDAGAGHEEARRVAREKAEADFQHARRDLQTHHETLADDVRRHETGAAVHRKRLTDLRRQVASPEGLAPWDAAVLDALREQRRLPASPLGARPMLKGSEAAVLMQETLGVSRSLYYDRFRPLLLTHYLAATEFDFMDDGSVWLARPKSGMRLRRDEVEALIQFITTGSISAPVATAVSREA